MVFLARQRRIPGITDEMILDKHNEGKSRKELAAYAGVSERAIRDVLYKNGVTNIKRPRKNKVNEQFFDAWSKEMAWVLGLVVTDGCIINSSRTMALIQKDERILKLVAKYMEADYVTTDHESRTLTLLVNSVRITAKLKELGVEENKSLTAPFKVVPEEFLPHYIRGVIDGDGWVQDRGYTMNVTSGSFDFADGLLGVFLSWGLNARIGIDRTPLGRPVYRVIVAGKNDLVRLSEIIYKDSGEACVYHKRDRMSQRANAKEEVHQLELF